MDEKSSGLGHLLHRSALDRQSVDLKLSGRVVVEVDALATLRPNGHLRAFRQLRQLLGRTPGALDHPNLPYRRFGILRIKGDPLPVRRPGWRALRDARAIGQRCLGRPIRIGKPDLQILSAALGDEGEKDLRSSVAISQGQLFVRTGKNLYCIGKK